MELITDLPDDMTPEEKKSLMEFKANGCPELSTITESLVFKWMNLYMAGKSYHEIQKITKSKKDLILYISERSKWNEKRLQYFGNISANLLAKLKESRDESANTVTSMLASFNRYYGGKFDKYLVSGDDSVIENLDLKMLANYYKSIDLIDKMLQDSVAPKQATSVESKKAPNININVNTGHTVEQIGEETVEINPAVPTASEILRALAQQKKNQQKT